MFHVVKLFLVAGSVGIQCTRSGISSGNGGYGDLDSVSPKLGWWMFEVESAKDAEGTERMRPADAARATESARATGQAEPGRVRFFKCRS